MNAEGQSPKTVRTYVEAAQWFAAEHLRARTDRAEVMPAHPPKMADAPRDRVQDNHVGMNGDTSKESAPDDWSGLARAVVGTDSIYRASAAVGVGLSRVTMYVIMWSVLPALVAAIASIVAATVAAVTAWKVGRWHQEVTLAVAEQQARSQQLLAREERQQQRLESAYRELANWLGSLYEWGNQIVRVCLGGHEKFLPPSPKWPSDEFATYWSNRVSELLAPVSYILLVSRARIENHNHGPARVLLESRPAVHTKAVEVELRLALNAIHLQMRLELHGEDSGVGDPTWNKSAAMQKTARDIQERTERVWRIPHDAARAPDGESK